jgi:hypothetical protein
MRDFFEWKVFLIHNQMLDILIKKRFDRIKETLSSVNSLLISNILRTMNPTQYLWYLYFTIELGWHINLLKRRKFKRIRLIWKKYNFLKGYEKEKYWKIKKIFLEMFKHNIRCSQFDIAFTIQSYDGRFQACKLTISFSFLFFAIFRSLIIWERKLISLFYFPNLIFEILVVL